MSEPELVAAARRVKDYYSDTVETSRPYGGRLYGPDGDFRPIQDRIVLADALLNPTTPAQRAAVAVLAGDTRPEVLAPILDELAERFAGGPEVEPWQVWTKERPTVPGWHWWLLPGRVPWAVYLQQGDQGLWFRLSAAEPRVFLTDTEDGCLWAGPIPHPAKPTA